jgi:hypothetical protein
VRRITAQPPDEQYGAHVTSSWWRFSVRAISAAALLSACSNGASRDPTDSPDAAPSADLAGLDDATDLGASNVDLATAGAADGGVHQPSVRIVAPTGTQALGAPFELVAEVSAVDPVVSVTATAGGKSYALAPTNSGANLYAISGVEPTTSGHVTLEVLLRTASATAKDTLTIDYLRDPPTLFVRAPAVDEVATPTLHVDATCMSALPGCHVTVGTGACVSPIVPLASADDHLDATITIDDAWDGNVVCLQAVDRAGHALSVARRIRAESSSAYERVYDAAEEIFDVALEPAPTHVVRAQRNWPLFYDANTHVDESEPMALVIETLTATPTSATIDASFVRGHDTARVSSAGVALVRHESGTIDAWSATSHEAASRNLASSPTVAQDWAAFLDNGEAVAYQTSKLLAGARTSYGPAESVDVAADGTVAFTTPIDSSCHGGELHLGGATIATHGVARDVRTDGTRAVYRWDDCHGSSVVGVYDSAQTLTPTAWGFPLDQAIANGWVVAMFYSHDTYWHWFWRRSPQGKEDEVQTLGVTAGLLEAVGGDGSFVYTETAANKRHLVDSAGNDRQIGAIHGRIVWAADGWYVNLGRSLFRIK